MLAANRQQVIHHATGIEEHAENMADRRRADDEAKAVIQQKWLDAQLQVVDEEVAAWSEAMRRRIRESKAAQLRDEDTSFTDAASWSSSSEEAYGDPGESPLTKPNLSQFTTDAMEPHKQEPFLMTPRGDQAGLDRGWRAGQSGKSAP
jgi:hypothetical protein